MQPWYILENFGNYIFIWLGTYGALLGPIDGIAIIIWDGAWIFGLLISMFVYTWLMNNDLSLVSQTEYRIITKNEGEKAAM
jgi:NCS1 family nucleobase:cation symporter-1